MARAIYIGGWGNGRSLAEGVAAALEPYHPEGVEFFTANRAENNLDQIHKAAKGAVAYSHSEGFRYLIDTNPSEIHAFGPPLPGSFLHLMGGTALKTLHMLASPETDLPAIKYLGSSMAELCAHPVRHVRALRPIMRFDAIKYGTFAVEAGIPTHLAYTNRDEFFQPSEVDKGTAQRGGLVMVELNGVHDQLPLLPDQTLEAYDAAGGFARR